MGMLVFGFVLLRVVAPWSSVERFSVREEQFPPIDRAEDIDALSREQMGMKVDVALRWQIDPQEAPKIFREIGNEDQIRSVVRNAIRNGVRDGMVQFTINDIAQRNQTLTPEALTKQYLEVLHDMRGSSNLVIMVPTEGGLPMLNLGDLRQNLRRP